MPKFFEPLFSQFGENPEYIGKTKFCQTNKKDYTMKAHLTMLVIVVVGVLLAGVVTKQILKKQATAAA